MMPDLNSGWEILKTIAGDPPLPPRPAKRTLWNRPDGRVRELGKDMVIVMSRRAAWIGVVAVVVAAGIPAGAADEGRLADYFGFLPLEVYKLDKRLNNLQVRDLDGDKTDDVIVVNNRPVAHRLVAQ